MEPTLPADYVTAQRFYIETTDGARDWDRQPPKGPGDVFDLLVEVKSLRAEVIECRCWIQLLSEEAATCPE